MVIDKCYKLLVQNSPNRNSKGAWDQFSSTNPSCYLFFFLECYLELSNICTSNLICERSLTVKYRSFIVNALLIY